MDKLSELKDRREGNSSGGVPVADIKKSEREAYVKYGRILRKDEDELASLCEKHLGKKCWMETGVELECVAVLPEGIPFDDFIPKEKRRTFFMQSSSMRGVVKEPRIEGHKDLTHDDLTGVQIEFVTEHRTKSYLQLVYPLRDEKAPKNPGPGNRTFPPQELQEAMKPLPDILKRRALLKVGPTSHVSWAEVKEAGNRRITPVRMARVLTSILHIADNTAKEYGLERIDFHSRPLKGERDQACGLQANINLCDEEGHNLFDDKNGKASPLMLCFIMELIESQKDGAALFAPTPEAFTRYKTFSAPAYCGLGGRRISSATGSALIRGAGYQAKRQGMDALQVEDPDLEEKPGGGGMRAEDRFPGPDMLTVSPEMPYLWMHYYLNTLKKAVTRYAQMKHDHTLESLDDKMAILVTSKRAAFFKAGAPERINDFIAATVTNTYTDLKHSANGSDIVPLAKQRYDRTVSRHKELQGNWDALFSERSALSKSKALTQEREDEFRARGEVMEAAGTALLDEEIGLYPIVRMGQRAHAGGSALTLEQIISFAQQKELTSYHPIPSDWPTALDQFKKSKRLEDILGPDAHAEIAHILEEGKAPKPPLKLPAR